jgi:hypothetical protein
MERHSCPGALPSLEPALRHELRVRRGDRVAGEAEIARQRPRRREPGARRQASAPERIPERPFEAAADPPSVHVEMQVDVTDGP